VIVIEVAVLFVIEAGKPPIVTDAPLRSVPVIKTLVPPDVEPVVGVIDVTAGGSVLVGVVATGAGLVTACSL
jgi:hypothetical protein